MTRQLSLSVVATAIVAFALGAFVSNRTPTVNAQPANPRGNCVGIAALIRTPNTPARIYRAFQDGTIEVAREDNNEIGEWKKLSK